MALSKGTVACTTGLAKAIYDERVALTATIGHGAGAAAEAALKADCYAIASAIVDYLVANTEVVISLTTGGLQTSTAAGAPTAPPTPLEQTLPIR
jgi:hypothetical protein